MKWPPSTELQFLKGVGPKYADVLRKKGLFTFQDLVEFYPRTYQDLSYNKKISDLIEGETVSLNLSVVGVKNQRISRFKNITILVLTDGSDVLDAKFFKSPYRGYFNQFEPGAKVQVSGKVKLYRNNFELTHPNISFIKDEADSKEKEPAPKSGINPIYSESERLNQKKVSTLIDTVFSLLDKDIIENSNKKNPWNFSYIPNKIKEKYKLLDRWEAIKLLHFPNIKEPLKNYLEQRTRAHLTLIFEEFFIFELLTALRKAHFKSETSPPLADLKIPLNDFLATLPFELTSDQKTAIEDICTDFEKSQPMHRLLQGDVGSGKTLVALSTAYTVITKGYQVVMMAPTEILAQQHFENAKKYLAPFDISPLCLTGKIKGKERTQIENLIKNGEAPFVIGTHALFEENVQFKNLGYVIIDEQHRFGVHQRQRLKSKGNHPHFLVMTATPIPRTLTMTLYGDLDVSLIQNLPPGRSPVETQFFYPKERTKVLQSALTELEKGHQAYFVFPLVSESESLDLKSAEFEYETLKEEFKNYTVGLLHGKMKPQEKDSIMENFRQNKIQVLVSTTVVEVGVDVPNATIMVIENSERFGLSQLHQLRGRVGRGRHPGKCFLILGNKFSKESLHRAKIMKNTTNGFIIAEEDLKMRGPGEVLGSRQSGLPEFKLADLLKHQKVLIEARDSAFAWIKDPDSKEHLKFIKEKFKHKLELINIS